MSSVTTTPDAAGPADGDGSGARFDFILWFDLNRKAILGGLAAILLIAVAALFWRWQRESRETEANHALIAATGLGASVTSESLAKVADDYKGTAAAERARLMVGGKLFEEGKFKESLEQFERWESDYPNGVMGATASYGKAASFEALGRTNEALSSYQVVIGAFASDPLATAARLARGRLQEGLGQWATALQTYEDAGRTAGAVWASSVAGARARLLAKHPELERPAPGKAQATNAPALPAKP